ncbi:hypothetical protein Q9966_010041 [Columba livia]|nr:hypothetical protein Q9966_010041 [Columba livia]
MTCVGLAASPGKRDLSLSDGKKPPSLSRGEPVGHGKISFSRIPGRGSDGNITPINPPARPGPAAAARRQQVMPWNRSSRRGFSGRINGNQAVFPRGVVKPG